MDQNQHRQIGFKCVDDFDLIREIYQMYLVCPKETEKNSPPGQYVNCASSRQCDLNQEISIYFIMPLDDRRIHSPVELFVHVVDVYFEQIVLNREISVISLIS